MTSRDLRECINEIREGVIGDLAATHVRSISDMTVMAAPLEVRERLDSQYEAIRVHHSDYAQRLKEERHHRLPRQGTVL